MNSRKKVLLGALGGVAAGALMGILFAPDKGSKTRKKIVDKSKDLANGMKGKFEELHENVSDKYENILQDAKKVASKEMK